MLDLGAYRPCQIPEDRLQQLTKLMSDAHTAFYRASIEQYGEARLKQLRDDYKQGVINLWCDPAARNYMKQLLAVEEELINGHIKLGVGFCNQLDWQHDSRPGVTYGDYMQCCADAIYDAIYTYTGRTKFSTYVTWCMKNRVIDFIRVEEHKSAPKLRVELTDFGKEDSDNPSEELHEAIKKASLTTEQRLLISAVLNGESQTDFCSKVLKNKVTKSYVSQMFIQACKKIKVAYLRQQAA